MSCPRCGCRTRYLTTDVRPVFARERRILQFYGYGHLVDRAVWKSSKSKYYYIDGESVALPDIEQVRANLPAIAEFIRDSDHYDSLDQQLIVDYRQALEINSAYLDQLEDKAFAFIQRVAKRYKSRLLMVSFSGGKDSTVVSDLVRRALGRSDILHVFGDTTLEDENTYMYIKAFRETNPLVPFFEARAEHDFHHLVEHMGPPSRKMRWCCTIFKAGPINNFLQTLGDHVKVLTFYGIRRSESVQRADYNAVTVGAKIGNQITASPVIDWTEFDIWLYIFLHKLPFNDSYRLGYSRVGCWLCPLNSAWSDMLAEIFFPQESERWREQLLDFARRIGKPDPEIYVAQKGWASRFGGAGLPNRWTGIDARPCGDMDNTVEYTVTRPVNGEILEFFKPLGRINQERGRKALGEFFVESENGRGFDLLVQALPGSDTIRVTVLDPTRADEIQRYVKYQVNKFQTCIRCTACAAACPFGAITVRPEQRVYEVNPDRCTHCNECVTHFGSTGCLVAKSLSSYGTAEREAENDYRDFIPLMAVVGSLEGEGSGEHEPTARSTTA